MSWKHLIISFILTFLGTELLAQRTGSIKGQVTDKETGETLPGVNIIIRGSSLGAASDLDGNYTISNIRPGEYSIEISYIGYERQLITGVAVEAGRESRLDIKLGMQVLSADEEIVVIGEKPIFDVEKSNSSITVSKSQIEAAPVQRVEQVVALQAGVTRDPTGLYIKGGRAYETGYVVDGVSAQDPLAGTGFGLDLGSNSLASVEVITGGVGAEYGDVTSGVVAVKTQDGGEKFSGFVSHKRDNLGSNNMDNQANFFSDIYEFNFGGPSLIFEKLLKGVGIDLPGTLSFFTSGQFTASDEFTKISADQVRTSMINSTFWSPRQDNRWNGIGKLTWNIKPGMKLQAAYQRSLSVNQNRNMLLITDANVQIQPGYQFNFQEDLDNANSYAHQSILGYVKWTHTLTQSSYYDIQVSRLFTRLRADANGRNWRPESVEGEYDAESIVTPPVEIFNVPQDFTYVLPGPGFVNNGGLSSLWHDHYAEEITAKGSYTKLYKGGQNEMKLGFEMKFQDYQWIDIIRPWVGAPIQVGEDQNGDPLFSQTLRLGQSSDVWQVNPGRGALFMDNKIRYKGLIANLGFRFEYWMPGSYVDNFVDQAIDYYDAVASGVAEENLPQRIPILEPIAREYLDDTFEIAGRRFKARLLPKISVSFPVRENQVLFFNYGHSNRVPHPSFVYAGLDPFYQDRSFLGNLGNPNLNPEVSINYEIGLRNQLSANDALNVSAFWNDRYDFVTSQRINFTDATGQETERSFRINGDYARSRGVELSYIKRYKDWFQGQVSVTYQRAEGLNSTNTSAAQDFIVGGQAEGNNIETPLAWDRPWDIKTNLTFTYNRKEALFGFAPLNKFQAFVSAIYRSGVRYTPVVFRGFSPNPVDGALDWRPVYETNPDPSARFSEVGTPWFMVDLNIKRWFEIGKVRLNTFVEITNVFDRLNAIRVNPITGEGYRRDYPTDQAALEALRDDRSYDVPNGSRDPRYVDPRDNSIPRFLDPANFLEQRHIIFGVSLQF